MTTRLRSEEWAFLVALLAIALAIGAALAHALELPNKMPLGREDYFTVQQIYAGWDRLAFLLLVEPIGIVWVIALYRYQRRVAVPASAALAGLIAAQVVFWLFTFPANRATANWTVQPANWEELRRSWEYSHLGGAAFQVFAFAMLVIAVLRRRVD
jgi:hypothetical protein